MHLNALYDLLNRSYEDSIIQPARQENEFAALREMVDRYHGASKTLFIADRNYGSYNIFAHIHEKGIKELYHMRWGIETSFRELKYAIGLTSFHSKKRDYMAKSR